MKIQVSQETLRDYMNAHDLKTARLAELIGKSPEMVISCFNHNNDKYGKPRSFTPEHIAAINEALPVIASELQARLMTFDSTVQPNRLGKKYDKSLVGKIKEIGRYINITALVWRLFKWSKGKKSAVLVQTSSKVYGAISEDIMIAINNELLGIIGVLSSYEVVADTASSDSKSSSSETAEPETSLTDEEMQQMYEEEMMLTEMEQSE